MFQILALISSRCRLGLVEIKFRAREAWGENKVELGCENGSHFRRLCKPLPST